MVPHPQRTKGRPCPLSNVDLFIPLTGKREVAVLHVFFSSLVFLPCYREFHIVVDEEEDYWNVVSAVPAQLQNVHVHLNPCPYTKINADVSLHHQWSDFWADNYTKAEFVMFMDSDSMFSHPLTCQSLFDEEGLPYWAYWPNYRHINSPAILEHIWGIYVGSFMTHFPIVVPAFAFPGLRKLVIDKMGATNFHDAILVISHMHPNSVSQFDLLGE